MTKKKRIILISVAAALIIICVTVLLICLLGKDTEHIRDMREVVSRGSFLISVDSQLENLPNTEQTYVFKSYDEFTDNSISELITYSTWKTIDDENIEFRYKAKNERYNEEYFQDNDLLVVFFRATINMIDYIIKDVQFTDNTCNIEVCGEMPTGSWGLRDERDVIYACFIERKEISESMVASVNVHSVTRTQSVLGHYVNADGTNVNLADEQLHAYLISDLSQLGQFITHNPNISNDDVLAFSLQMKYNEVFFRENALMLFVVPGLYYGNIAVNGNSFTGMRLYSDHYITPSEKTGWDANFNYTGVISVAIDKSFSYSEIKYSFFCYEEWEDGTFGNNIEISPIVLRLRGSDTEYKIYTEDEEK